LPVFEKTYKEFLSKKSQNDTLNAKKEQILTNINTILGVTEPNIVLQDQTWERFLKAFSSMKMTFRLVHKNIIKDYLLSGERLPNLTYDKDSDMVINNIQFEYSGTLGFTKNVDFVFPIDSIYTFDKDIEEIFQKLHTLFDSGLSAGVSIHEIVESILFMRAKPTDPYWRWFNDGVANAITYELLKKHFGTQDANDFIKVFDLNHNEKELQKEINLRYWMIGNYCILLNDMPTKTGQQFDNARYTYATFEARRLIDNHGIDCVRKILDEISTKPSRNGSDLIETIKNITGEDMDARLEAYQNFGNKPEGILKYIRALNEASNSKDSEQILFNMFRMHEMRSLVNLEFLNEYRNVAILLFQMGFETDADMVMNNCMEFFSNQAVIAGRPTALEAYILYTLECKKPLMAKEVAEELLKTAPNNPNALAIQIFVYLEDKQLNQAKELAQKVISLSRNKDSISYKAASSVLAIDPNQLNAGK
jgi:hypothetical protein